MNSKSDRAWCNKLDNAHPFESLANLPRYGYQFFYRNIHPFATEFVLLTIVSVVSNLLSYFAVWQVSQVISRITEITLSQLTYHYFPTILLCLLGMESLDYFLRRNAEMFPAVYNDFMVLRFYKTFLQLNARKVFNTSKERLQILVMRYMTGVNQFLGDWFWGTSRKLVSLVIVLAILYVQSRAVFFCNLTLFAILILISLKISSRLSPIARSYTEQSIESSSVTWSFLMNLNTVRRLGLYSFFVDHYQRNTLKSWEKLGDVKRFHASRWFVQLNLYQVMYAGTIVYGAYQVKVGELALGYLVLIKYAFDKLWDILVFISEYYVVLIQQREDALVVSQEFYRIFGDSKPSRSLSIALDKWKGFSLKDVDVTFAAPGQVSRQVNIKVPSLAVSRGDKIGIIGPSGIGKTTLLGVLQNLVDFNGIYEIDNVRVTDEDIPASFMTVINNTDYLFNISIRDNIELGSSISSDIFEATLAGIKANEFLNNLDVQCGSPDFNLSAGQLQRVRLARGLLQQSAVYLLDEPFNGIDQEAKASIIDYLRFQWREATVILVTHDRTELALVDKVYEFKGGVLTPGL